MKPITQQLIRIWIMALFVMPVARGDAQERDKPLNPAYENLVGQLGDPSFKVREQAYAKLIELGLLARAEITAAFDSPDPEIRRRTRRIYDEELKPKILEERLQRLVDDADGTLEHDLPAWDLYREKMGSSPAERTFFASMLRAEEDFFRAIDRRPEGLSELVSERIKQIKDSFGVSGPEFPRIESIASVILGGLALAASEPEWQREPLNWLLSCYHSKLNNGWFKLETPLPGVGKRLMCEWSEVVVRDTDSSGWKRARGLSLFLAYGFGEDRALNAAREVLRSKTLKCDNCNSLKYVTC